MARESGSLGKSPPPARRQPSRRLAVRQVVNQTQACPITKRHAKDGSWVGHGPSCEFYIEDTWDTLQPSRLVFTSRVHLRASFAVASSVPCFLRTSAPDRCRFGFSRDCLVVAGSGDNCNSLAGMGVFSVGGSNGGEGGRGGGDVMVSLGTSDTLLGVTGDPSPTTTGMSRRWRFKVQRNEDDGIIRVRMIESSVVNGRLAWSFAPCLGVDHEVCGVIPTGVQSVTSWRSDWFYSEFK